MAGDSDGKRCRKWNDWEIFFLISKWKNCTLEFNDYKRNSPIYHRIGAEFSKCNSDRSVQDIRTKIGNLMLEYRHEKLNKRNGCSSSWRFFSAVDEVIQNMPKKAIPMLLYAPDGTKSIQQPELPISPVTQEMELDDAKKLKICAKEEAIQLLKTLVTSHGEYLKMAKGTDDKLLEIAKNLRYLQETSSEIGANVQQQLKLIIQAFEKEELKSDSSVNMKELTESLVSEQSESISLLSLHDHNELGEVQDDCAEKPVSIGIETKNPTMEGPMIKRKTCKSTINSSENSLPFHVNELESNSASWNVGIKVEPQNYAEQEIHENSNGSKSGVSGLNNNAIQSICSCHSSQPVPHDHSVRDDQLQNEKKLLELESSESDDDDIYFLKSVLPDLRGLPRAKKAYVKLKIQEIIFSQVYGNV